MIIRCAGGFCLQVDRWRRSELRSGAGRDSVPHESGADCVPPLHRETGRQRVSDYHRWWWSCFWKQTPLPGLYSAVLSKGWTLSVAAGAILLMLWVYSLNFVSIPLWTCLIFRKKWLDKRKHWHWCVCWAFVSPMEVCMHLPYCNLNDRRIFFAYASLNLIISRHKSGKHSVYVIVICVPEIHMAEILQVALWYEEDTRKVFKTVRRTDNTPHDDLYGSTKQNGLRVSRRLKPWLFFFLLSGSQRFSCYSGYSDNFEWAGPYEDRLPRY